MTPRVAIEGGHKSNQIDQLVYELYGLTESEIKIIENRQ